MKPSVVEQVGGLIRWAWPSLVAALLLCSCSRSGEKPAADCESTAAKAGSEASAKVERIGLGRVGEREKREGDWCRACVWSKVGFASCQRVFAEKDGEDRDTVRARARAKACKDAGWPVDACPEDKVISLLCSGDAPLPGTKNPGAALQDLYRKLNPDKFQGAPTDAGPGSDAGAAPAAPAAPVVQ